MPDTRKCAQCGSVFVPRREHARFCSAHCRAAWDQERVGDPAAEISALDWSVTAMRDTTERLPQISARDRRRACTVIGEAVWWVTMVDATLVRHHPDSYDTTLASHPPAERPLIEETLTGLRFVRNQIGRGADTGDFIRPAATKTGADTGRIAAWTWKPVPEPEPALSSVPARTQAWEKTRYQAYQSRLADRTISEVFGPAATFLSQAVASATSIPDDTVHVAR